MRIDHSNDLLKEVAIFISLSCSNLEFLKGAIQIIDFLPLKQTNDINMSYYRSLNSKTIKKVVF